jgi:hypothetical protein
VACHILLEISSWGLQLCFRPHFNQRSIEEVMDLQNCESPNFEHFGIPKLGVPWQNGIWVLTSWLNTKNTIRRKVVVSPEFGLWWVLWVRVYPWWVLLMHPQTFWCTSRNWPKCNHSIYNYMQLLIICNYIWTFLQLFLVLFIFVTTLQLVCNYFGVHLSMWTTFSLVFIQVEHFISH